LYRGSCALNAEIREPFAFCAAIGNSPVLPAAGGEPARLLPQALLASMRTQGLSNSEMPDYVQAAAHWRCMNSEVYVCPVGANLPCEEPANLSQTPRKAMQEFCTENPDADGMPAYVTGRATVYNWNCIDGQAVVGEQRFTADAQGYLAEFWHRLSRLKSVAVEP
jgi:hypothetical protein